MFERLSYYNLEIDGKPVLATEFEYKPSKPKWIEKEVMGAGVLRLDGIPEGRSVKFKIKIKEDPKTVREYFDQLAKKVIKVSSPKTGTFKGVINDVGIEYNDEFSERTEDGAVRSYCEVSVEIVETIEIQADVDLTKAEKQAQTPTTSPQTSTKPKEVTVKCKPSCMFCIKYDGYKYKYYEAKFENKCPHCSGTLTHTTSGAPEGRLHCTRCGANYCCVCGREKVRDRSRAEKYRLKVLVKAKEVK